MFEHKHGMLTNFVSCVFRFYVLITISPPYSAAVRVGTVQTGRAELDFCSVKCVCRGFLTLCVTWLNSSSLHLFPKKEKIILNLAPFR